MQALNDIISASAMSSSCLLSSGIRPRLAVSRRLLNSAGVVMPQMLDSASHFSSWMWNLPSPSRSRFLGTRRLIKSHDVWGTVSFKIDTLYVLLVFQEEHQEEFTLSGSQQTFCNAQFSCRVPEISFQASEEGG